MPTISESYLRVLRITNEIHSSMDVVVTVVLHASTVERILGDYGR